MDLFIRLNLRFIKTSATVSDGYQYNWLKRNRTVNGVLIFKIRKNEKDFYDVSCFSSFYSRHFRAIN